MCVDSMRQSFACYNDEVKVLKTALANEVLLGKGVISWPTAICLTNP